MLQEVVLPQLGQTMEEGTIEKWHKSVGDTVAKGEVFYELSTDKATLEVESFAEGKVLALFAEEGETVPVNELIALVGAEGDALPEDLEAYRERVSKARAAPPPETGEAKGRRTAPPSETPGVHVAQPEAAPAPAGRIFASPRARKIAEEQDVPVAALRGTGPSGRIIERDVLAYLEKLEDIPHTPAARKLAAERGIDLTTLKPADPGGRITKEDVLEARPVVPAQGQRLPLSIMRQTIARRMSESKQSVPHFYLVGQVRMKAAQEFRKKLNASTDTKITITDLLVKAAAIALREHPRMNAQFDGDAIRLRSEINIGVAVAVEDGLFVPVIKEADTKDLAAISSDLKQLAEAARKGTLIPEQYEGGSLTISNLGAYGVDYFLPIINPPESCIIGVGTMSDQVLARDGQTSIEPVMKLSLSGDHRVVDGAEAGEFFQTLREALESPERLGDPA